MPLPDMGLSALDFAAVAVFFGGWILFALVVDAGPLAKHTLTTRMNEARRRWMLRMLTREVRMVDTAILANLLNGTVFFASTSILAIGGSVALLGATERIMAVASDVPFLVGGMDPAAWEAKILVFTMIFVYAFFKFGWAFRLFNYCSILVGAAPLTDKADTAEARDAALRAAEMNIQAAKQFNRGLRAYFFALAYLGWFIGPLTLMLTTALVCAVLAHRQFASRAFDIAEAFAPDKPETPTGP